MSTIENGGRHRMAHRLIYSWQANPFSEIGEQTAAAEDWRALRVMGKEDFGAEDIRVIPAK